MTPQQASSSWSWSAAWAPDTIVAVIGGTQQLGDYTHGFVNAREGYAIYKVTGQNGREYWVAAGSSAALREVGLNPGVANSADTMKAVRAAGRGGDSALYAIGFMASVAPNLSAHAIQGDFFSKATLADFAVDTGGWLFSEGAGLLGAGLAGALSQNPLMLIPGEIGGSIVGSLLWDNAAAPGLRLNLMKMMQ